MGVYLKELFQLQKSDEVTEISLLIEQSLRTPSVYFEARHKDDKWKLYWNYEIPVSEFLPVIKEYVAVHLPRDISFADAIADPGVQEVLLPLNKTYVCMLDDKDIEIISEICEKELKSIDKKPQGLDGHSYEIQIFKKNITYRCWCVIPKDWESIIPLINLCTEKASLNDKYDIYGIR